jgi:copper chaperone
MTLTVAGMTCQHCVQTVKGALEKINGVQAVTVTLEKGRVEIAFDPSKTRIERFREAIQDAGYEVN